MHGREGIGVNRRERKKAAKTFHNSQICMLIASILFRLLYFLQNGNNLYGALDIVEGKCTSDMR